MKANQNKCKFSFQSVIWISFGVLIIGFQNCSVSKYDFNQSEGTLDLLSLQQETQLITTELNTSYSFKLPYSTTAKKLQILIQKNPANGTLKVESSQDLKLSYVPQFGFRGQDQAEVVLQDFYGNSKKFYLQIVVGNPFSNFEPALAIRGMGCVQCHSSVSSDIVTDFGYPDDVYFGNKLGGDWWKSGSIYGDHGQNWHSMVLGNSTRILVPKARLPENIRKLEVGDYLDDYLTKQLERSSNALTAKTPVIAKNKVYIGAPTSADLREAFHISVGERVKYYFDASETSNTRPLKGLKDNGTYFSVKGLLDCDGDLFVAGPLLIENMSLNTSRGCRIYVDGSIFIYGAVSYRNSGSLTNLQLVSSRSINLGLGSVKKNGNYCDTQSHYYLNRGSNTYIKGSSLSTRYQDIWTVPSHATREFKDSSAIGRIILAESQLIEKGEGEPLLDAECRVEGRDVPFERLLLNAPIIHNRYKGNFKGTIIAEIGLMSLGTFTFSFDPVFQRATVLPFLHLDRILKLE